MARRINWSDIFIFYVSTDTITLRDCAEKFEVSYDVLRQQASKQKWRQQKKEKQQETRQMVIQKIEQELSITIAGINIKHIELAKVLQAGGIKALAEGTLPKSTRDIQSWISAGVSMERRALGMNNPNHQKIEQPDVSTNQTTNDKLLEDGIKK